MKKLLQYLNRVVGVIGSFVCDEEGNIVEREIPEVYSDSSLREVSHIISKTFETISATGRGIKQIEYEYNDYRLIIRKFTYGFLVVLCNKAVSLAMLNMAFKVVVQKIEMLIVERTGAKFAKIDRETFDKIMEKIIERLSKFYGKEMAKVAMSTARRKFELSGNELTPENLKLILLPIMEEKFEGIMNKEELEKWLEELLKEREVSR